MGLIIISVPMGRSRRQSVTYVLIFLFDLTFDTLHRKTFGTKNIFGPNFMENRTFRFLSDIVCLAISNNEYETLINQCFKEMSYLKEGHDLVKA